MTTKNCGDRRCRYADNVVGTNMTCRCDDCPECGMDTKRVNKAIRHTQWCSRRGEPSCCVGGYVCDGDCGPGCANVGVI